MATDFSNININSLTSQPFTNVFTGKQENTPSLTPKKTTNTSSPILGKSSQPLSSGSTLAGKVSLSGIAPVQGKNMSNSDYYSLIAGTSKPVAPVIAADTATSRSTTPPPVTPPATRLKESNIMPAVESTLAGANATVTTPTDTKPKNSLKTSMEQYLQNQISRDTSAERASLRTEAQTAEKEKEARILKEKLASRKTYYERLIEEKEKNREGKSTAQLSAEVDDISRKANRELADLGVQYEIANNDYVAAENLVNERIKDIQVEDNRLANVFSTMFNFVQNDMTESEKLQAQQAFQTLQDDRQFERQKELAAYNAQLKKAEATSNGLTTLSPEDNAKLNATPQAKAIQDASKYAKALQDYKDAINTYGTGQVLGKGSGVLGQTYSALVGATKDYYTLGSYDNGVQKLIELGIKEPSVFGLKGGRIGALDSALKGATESVSKNAKQLQASTFGNSIEVKTLLESAGITTETPDPLDFGVNANPLNLDL